MQVSDNQTSRGGGTVSRITFNAPVHNRALAIFLASASLSGLGKPPVAATVIEQRLAAVMLACDDLPYEDLMITPRQDVDHLAIEVGQAFRQDWRPGCRGRGLQFREVFRPRRCELTGEAFLLRPEVY